MSRWIDLDDDRNCYCGQDGEYEKYNIDPDVLNDCIDIIRCKDCRYYSESTVVCSRYGLTDDDYCSWAERKEE